MSCRLMWVSVGAGGVISPLPEKTVRVLPSSVPSDTEVVTRFHRSKADGIESPFTVFPLIQNSTTPDSLSGAVQVKCQILSSVFDPALE